MTIEDVAVAAGIGKGTVYLHWRTREELFRAVCERETGAAIEGLVAVLRRERGAWRPHRFTRAYFVAIVSRPLLRALVLADATMLGKLAGPDGSARERRHRAVSEAYFAHLASHGVVREDLGADALSYTFLTTLEGFLRADDGAALGLDVEARTGLLALVIRSALETGREREPATEAAVRADVIELIRRLAEADRADPSSTTEGRAGA